ncbi:hypothetical protein C8J57DRAFT_1326324 [Mycena rebaudengoi]|nr:hypothetical protein C8J57DRAFT_1326324 [Mycena rebaudengoi]
MKYKLYSYLPRLREHLIHYCLLHLPRYFLLAQTAEMWCNRSRFLEAKYWDWSNITFLVATGNYEFCYEAPVRDRERAYPWFRNKYEEKERISELHSTKPMGTLALDTVTHKPEEPGEPARKHNLPAARRHSLPLCRSRPLPVASAEQCAQR